MAHRFDIPGHSRLFLAIRLPEVVKSDLAAALSTFKDHKDISLTRTDNLHITVHFFGNIENEHVTSLIHTIDSNLRDISAFNLKLDQLVIYPPRRPRMIRASFEHSTQFEVLAAKFQDLAANGKKPADTREQKPHVTCARLRQNRKVNYLVPSIVSHTILVDHIELWKSVAGDGGVKYEAIASFPLQ